MTQQLLFRLTLYRNLLLRIWIVSFLFCMNEANADALPRSKAETIVRSWISTVDRTKLLAREPDLVFGTKEPQSINISINADMHYQEMVGFGASITDASAWLIQNKLNSVQRAALMQDLFGQSPGLGLSFTRLTIGSSDFSRYHYSYDDMPPGQTDPELSRFSINANRGDVLPVVKQALQMNPQLRVMASPWSAPGWMKTTDSLIGGSLRPEAYGPFADYLLRYIDAYAAEGVPIYALTLQNEPHFEPANYPGMRLEPAARARVIGEFLGPKMAKKGMSTRILDWDHNWNEPDAPLNVLADPRARDYIAGVAWHCYAGDVTAQVRVHDAYPDKDTFFTECSGGGWEPLKGEGLVWLTRNLIVGATRGWARGVLFWNLALDESYGPHLGGCSNCYGVVTIDSTSGKVTRNQEYYALAHASRFVRPGARRIDSNAGVAGLSNVAFQNQDNGSLVLIVVNSSVDAKDFSVQYRARTFHRALPGKSVITFIWDSKSQ